MLDMTSPHERTWSEFFSGKKRPEEDKRDPQSINMDNEASALDKKQAAEDQAYLDKRDPQSINMDNLYALLPVEHRPAFAKELANNNDSIFRLDPDSSHEERLFVAAVYYSPREDYHKKIPLSLLLRHLASKRSGVFNAENYKTLVESAMTILREQLTHIQNKKNVGAPFRPAAPLPGDNVSPFAVAAAAAVGGAGAANTRLRPSAPPANVNTRIPPSAPSANANFPARQGGGKRRIRRKTRSVKRKARKTRRSKTHRRSR
jgi:hypothetical protein